MRPRTPLTLCLALALGLTACADDPVATPAVEATPICSPDVAVVAVRGSNEPSGLAGPAGVVARAVVAALPGRTVTVTEVDYPATLAGYEESVRAGIAGATAALTAAASACSDTRIVAVGYSQGAQVLGGALAEQGRDLLARIRAVVLVADPSRDASDPGAELHRGSAGAGPGEDGLLGGRAVPEEVAGRALHWCNPDDAVCDGAACSQGALACLLGGPGLAAHGDYGQDDVGPVTTFVTEALGLD